MMFYQAYDDNRDGELYQYAENAFHELKSWGYEIVGLRSRDNSFPLYDPSRNIGIGVIFL